MAKKQEGNEIDSEAPASFSGYECKRYQYSVGSNQVKLDEALNQVKKRKAAMQPPDQ
jgi:hypothetical protein